MKQLSLIAVFLISIQSWSQTPSMKEMKMIDEINLVRMDPPGYCQYIQAYLDYWQPADSVYDIANELIDTLQKMQPLDSLWYKQDLYVAAVQHGNWMLDNQLFEHSDFDYGENLVAGDSLARFAVISLLIDDGVPDRGHRWNILDSYWIYVACRFLPGEVDGVPFNWIQEFE